MATSTSTAVDLGLRNYMVSVYNNMGLGLLISSVISYVVGTSPQLTQFFLGGPQAWLFILAPIILALVLIFAFDKLSVSTARTLFFVYAALMGVSLASVFIVYKLGSIFQVFLITSIMFGSMSVYGYTTKRDLTGLGSLMFMGLIGIIVAGLVNLFLQNDLFQLVIAAIGVIVFVGLTAYDTQKIKEIYYNTSGTEREKAGVMGALSLYLDFVNLMLYMLQLFGQRR